MFSALFPVPFYNCPPFLCVSLLILFQPVYFGSHYTETQDNYANLPSRASGEFEMGNGKLSWPTALDIQGCSGHLHFPFETHPNKSLFTGEHCAATAKKHYSNPCKIIWIPLTFGNHSYIINLVWENEGAWCNGNTWVSKTFVEGSNPSAPARTGRSEMSGYFFMYLWPRIKAIPHN